MSSQSIENKVVIFPYYDTYKGDSINFKKIIIPFSDFGRSKNPSYIYMGIEKISFKERHPVYQAIFLNEFV